jgi:hypothetical protein
MYLILIIQTFFKYKFFSQIQALKRHNKNPINDTDL